MDNEKNHFFKFKRKKIKYKKENPIQDLIDLYAEEEKDLNGAEPKVMDAKNENRINKPKDEHYLKELINKKHQHPHKKIISLSLISFLVLAGAALAGFLYFSSDHRPVAEDVNLTIEAPDKIQINEEFTYTINYQNQSNAGFLTSRISVQYPKGFILIKSEPAIYNHKWELGALSSGQAGKILLTGKIIDTTFSEQKLIANFTF